MKKIAVLSLCLVMLTSVLVGCAGKYADVKRVNAQFVRTTEEYIAKLEKADSAARVAQAMNSYADEMEKVWPRMQKAAERYPELKNRSDPPKGLEECQRESEAIGKQMAGTFMKIMPYISDPEVARAQERLAKIMVTL